jgi:hypothetical protein
MDTDVGTPQYRPPRGVPAALLLVVVTTAVIAVPYWTADEASVRDDGIFGHFFWVALAVFTGTFLAGAVTEAPLWAVLAGMLWCTPIAVLGRVVLDTAADPTSHNLWPLELVLAGAMAVPAVCAGAALAWIARIVGSTGR